MLSNSRRTGPKITSNRILRFDSTSALVILRTASNDPPQCLTVRHRGTKFEKFCLLWAKPLPIRKTRCNPLRHNGSILRSSRRPLSAPQRQSERSADFVVAAQGLTNHLSGTRVLASIRFKCEPLRHPVCLNTVPDFFNILVL